MSKKTDTQILFDTKVIFEFDINLQEYQYKQCPCHLLHLAQYFRVHHCIQTGTQLLSPLTLEEINIHNTEESFKIILKRSPRLSFQ